MVMNGGLPVMSANAAMLGNNPAMIADSHGELNVEGDAPSLGNRRWQPSPLTVENLRGKWCSSILDTSCINCLHHPYVRAWADKLRTRGLVGSAAGVRVREERPQRAPGRRRPRSRPRRDRQRLRDLARVRESFWRRTAYDRRGRIATTISARRL